MTGDAFKNERVPLMNADHRGVCKFQSTKDTNYVSLKNALVLVVSELLQQSKLTLKVLGE